jgi:hypothetical protein
MGCRYSGPVLHGVGLVLRSGLVSWCSGYHSKIIVSFWSYLITEIIRILLTGESCPKNIARFMERKVTWRLHRRLPNEYISLSAVVASLNLIISPEPFF